MRCPKCAGGELLEMDGGVCPARRCTTCRGLWVDGDSLLAAVEKAGGAEQREKALLALGDPGEDTSLPCPRCVETKTLIRVRIADVRVETCPACLGVYLDAGELAVLAGRPMQPVHHDGAPVEALQSGGGFSALDGWFAVEALAALVEFLGSLGDG